MSQIGSDQHGSGRSASPEEASEKVSMRDPATEAQGKETEKKKGGKMGSTRKKAGKSKTRSRQRKSTDERSYNLECRQREKRR